MSAKRNTGNCTPKPLEIGDRVIVKVALGHKAYYLMPRELRDTWVKGSIETNLSWSYESSVWVKLDCMVGLLLAGPKNYSAGEIIIIRDVSAPIYAKQELANKKQREKYTAKKLALAKLKAARRLANFTI